MDGPNAGRVAPTDDYEAGAMTGAGRVIHRDKVVARGLALMMVIYGAVFTALCVAIWMGAFPTMSLFSKALVPPLAVLFWVTGLTRTVLRTLVTTEEVHIQQGLWGPRIPIASITGCEVIAYKAGNIPRGVLLHVPSARERVVRLDFTDAKAQARTAVIAANDPDLLAAKIDEARRVSSVRLRVEGDRGASADLESIAADTRGSAPPASAAEAPER